MRSSAGSETGGCHELQQWNHAGNHESVEVEVRFAAEAQGEA
ncbi:hypothetical protein ABZ464_41315 [Streptomyces sp. NPDC005820]